MRFRFDFPGGDWKMVNRRDAVTGVSPGQDALVRLSLAGDRTPTQAMERFLAQGGVRAERPRRTRVGGFDAVATYFEAQGEGGMVAGRVIYLDQGGRVFQLLGYAPAARFRSWDRALGASLESFRPLTDRRALEVEPARLAVVTLDRDMTLEEFARRVPSSVSLDELALLNRVEPVARLGRGELVKRVVGGPER
jgi:predicted Zn-dependent protease